MITKAKYMTSISCFFKNQLKGYYRFLGILFMLIVQEQLTNAQITVRYKSDIQGGATIIGNSWFYSAPGAATTRLTPDIDNIAGTTLSTSADLILPAGSKIIKAFLSLEKGSAGTPFTSVRLKVPGASDYQLIVAPGSYFLISRLASLYNQSVFDITSLMPNDGFVSTAGGGAAGRYFLADPTPAPSDMGGWSIIVVYTNPASKFRNVTVADNWQYFNGTSVNTDISGIKIPSSGVVKAVVGVTGTYGDRGYTDNLLFGEVSGTLTALADPMTGVTNDALNSSIAMTPLNNVSEDGGPSISGNVTTRNPISAGHYFGTAESWDYDADVFNASGVLAASATPINIRLQQQSTGGDVLVSGSYFVSVNLANPPKLIKSVAPATMTDEGTATYTWTISNTGADAVTQTNLDFVDTLPSNIIVAAVPDIVITGGAGGVVTASAGAGKVSLSGLTLNAGQTATIKVNITNRAGQLNGSCATNPAGFTNSATNISAISIVDLSSLTPQCITITPKCYATGSTPDIH